MHDETVQEYACHDSQRNADYRDQYVLPVYILAELNIIKSQDFQRRQLTSSLADVDVVQVVQYNERQCRRADDQNVRDRIQAGDHILELIYHLIDAHDAADCLVFQIILTEFL